MRIPINHILRLCLRGLPNWSSGEIVATLNKECVTDKKDKMEKKKRKNSKSFDWMLNESQLFGFGKYQIEASLASQVTWAPKANRWTISNSVLTCIIRLRHPEVRFKLFLDLYQAPRMRIDLVIGEFGICRLFPICWSSAGKAQEAHLGYCGYENFRGGDIIIPGYPIIARAGIYALSALR